MNPDKFQSWTWTLPEGGPSNDLAALESGWSRVLARGGWQRSALGIVGADRLWLLERPAKHPGAPHRLVAAGFHGEEPAGPWGVLRYFESASDAELDAIHLCVLPLVNATGFRAGTRLNAWGENPNRGHGEHAGEAPSKEGQVLAQHAAQLLRLGRDGVISCHEDVKRDHAYVYTLEDSPRPGPFSTALAAANARHFPIHPDGSLDGLALRDGIVFNQYDGSFEAWMMELGAIRAACVETPGLQPIVSRIAAQRDMVEAFVRFRT